MARKAFDVEALEDVALLRRQTPSDTLGARVVSWSLSPAFRVVRLRIDRGDGEVEAGMPVITSAGLVGKIFTVYGGHADVLLLTDPRSSVAVVVKRTGGVGMLTGVGAPDRYAAKVEWLDRAATPDAGTTIQIGVELYTSGQGGAFPAGILVGRVAAVSTKDYPCAGRSRSPPSVSFSRLRAVLVLLAPPPPPDRTAKKDKRSEPAFGVRPI